ncbi:Hypothetical predicted protein [Cloeon dipterum]|uniref:SANT domain-containing protein n=1 Tax=Cloeon dipterum TaxID=197152 RepID=A0A8S1C1H6_9INSE|nr:Hypothetical predicted protein [Cloeon dipterum]
MEKSGQQIRECLHSHDLRSLDATMVTEGSSVEPQNVAKLVPVRTSARVLRKVKLDQEIKSVKEEKCKPLVAGPVKPLVAGPCKPLVTGPCNSSNTDGKRKRSWGLWSVEEKNTFFEALNEYGKNFDAIQNYFLTKAKKKPDFEAKKKDQVRYFYYRNWHKISKFIDFKSDLGKVNLELFALINYGELRKRLGRSVLDKNLHVKLQELIFDGTTQIKLKGKTIRIKTPPCRALRRLGQMDKREDAPKLPARVSIEMRPLNNTTWSFVHCKAQNPRVVANNLSIQYKLYMLITALQNKWQSRDSKALEKLASVGEMNVPTPKQTMRLRLAPRAGLKISLPSVSSAETTTVNPVISLKALEERLISIRKQGGQRKPGSKRSKKKVAAVNVDKSESQYAAATEQLLALQLEGDDATDGDLKKFLKETDCEDVEVSIATRVETIKSGWTLENANQLTLGDLYAMFGENSRLLLDYSWEEIPSIVAVNGYDKAFLTTIVHRLISMARLMPMLKSKSSCPCGHVCSKRPMRNRQKASKPKAAAGGAAASMVTPKEPAPSSSALQASAVVIPSTFPQGASVSIQATPVAASVPLFRRPLLAPSQVKSNQQQGEAEEAFKARMEQFGLKKYCNRPGRTSRKNMTVQRVVSTLLPKVPDGMVALMPKNIVTFTSGRANVILPVIQGPAPSTAKPKKPKAAPAPPVATFPAEAPTPTVSTFEPKATITSLLGLNPEDLSLGVETSSLKDVTLSNDDTTPSFVGLLGQSQSTVPEPPAISPPMSPTQILKESDNQWLNADVSEFSLSSFLGHLESPMKTSVNGTNADDSRMSQDVEAQFQSLLSENSLEFISNFADLASHFTPDSTSSSKK